MQALFRKDLNALRPASEEAEELLRKLKLGKEVMVEVKRPRNLQWHKLYWKTMQLIADNLDVRYSPEAISDYIKLQIGHVNVYEINGQVMQTPKSISFANMDQTEWEAYWEQAINYACEHLIPGLKSEELKNEVLRMVS